MLTETEYLIAWFAYAVAVGGVLSVTWKVLSVFTLRIARKFVVGLLLALLLTPWSVSVGGDRLAPALFVGVFDATLQKDAAMFRAFFPLSISLMVMVLLLVAEHFLNRKHRGLVES